MKRGSVLCAKHSQGACTQRLYDCATHEVYGKNCKMVSAFHTDILFDFT